MSDKTPKYITTTLPYVNADPHIGFGLELVQADALARYHRLMGHEVFFNTGTDEHGQKIADKADKEGKGRQEYVDHYADQFNKLKDSLNLDYTNFIRTTDDTHKAAAQELWKRCDEAGDIYKKKYKGLYCVGDEMFMKESDLVDGRCPNHPNMELQEIEEENWFFALSKYQKQLEEYLCDASRTAPDWQRKWALDFVQGGLEDLSISRSKSRMDWGVSVPGDDDHVMYVWFDALTNYISTLGWPNEDGDFGKFWVNGETLQMAGKDQVRFQSIIFQAMLMSAGIKQTDKIVYHGFINSDGQKMSKSLGNVISPYEMVEKYGTDAARYMLLRHVHPFDDSDVTWEKMDEWYTANLVNGLGNLTARILKMSETHIDSISIVHDRTDTVHLEAFDFQKAMDFIWSKIQNLDEQIAETEPFKLVKTDKEAAQAIISDLLKGLYGVAWSLKAYMPETSEIILAAIKANKKPENLFNRLET